MIFRARSTLSKNTASHAWQKSVGTLILAFILGSCTLTGADHFADRETLFGSFFTTTAESSKATIEPGEPSHGDPSGPHKSLWWQWTASTTGPIRLETTGSSFDTVIAVYQGTSFTNLKLIGWNDDAGLSSTSVLTFDAASGETYLFAVDGFDETEGTIVLTGSQSGDDMIYKSDFSLLDDGPNNLFGSQGWQSLFADDVSGIAAESGQNRGYLSSAADAGDVAALWLPINYESVPSKKGPISLALDWSVQHDNGTCACSYLLLFYGEGGDFLAGLEFEVGSATVLRLDGATKKVTGFPFNAWENQRLKIWLDSDSNTWSAKLDDFTLFDRATFTVASPLQQGIGSVSIGWTCDIHEAGISTGQVSFAKIEVARAESMPEHSTFVFERHPYERVRQKIPGPVETERYDEGGAWVAFYDTTATNAGGKLRADGVDITSNTEGFNIGWFDAGEWLLYSVDVSKTARYKVDARVVSKGSGGLFRVEVDGIDVSGPLTIPDTKTWTAWTTVSFKANLEAGEHDIRIVGLRNGSGNGGFVGDIDALEFEEFVEPVSPSDGLPAAPSSLNVKQPGLGR